jgi:hypothetical protein
MKLSPDTECVLDFLSYRHSLRNILCETTVFLYSYRSHRMYCIVLLLYQHHILCILSISYLIAHTPNRNFIAIQIVGNITNMPSLRKDRMLLNH